MITLIVGVGYQGNTGGNEFWAGGNDDDIVALGPVKTNLVIGRRLVSVLEFSLGYRGSKGDIPQGGGISAIGLTAGKIAQKSPLRDALRLIVNRAVGEIPVDAQPQRSPEVFKLFFIFECELFA